MYTTAARKPSPPWPAIVAGLLLLSLVASLAWVCDDSYITLRTVDNWLHGYGLRWNVAERVQAYTHPLWMLALTALYGLTHDGFVSMLSLGIAATGGTLWLLSRLALTPVHAALVLGGLALSRSFLHFSTSGLEGSLTHLLLCAFVSVYVRPSKPARLLALSALAGLLALSRLDALLLVAPALSQAALVHARSQGLRRSAALVALGLVPLWAWELFSLLYYGLLVPNTALAKLHPAVGGWALLGQGLYYLASSCLWDPQLLLLGAWGLSAAWRSRRLPDRLLALGALLYSAYVVCIGGDFMLGRLLTPPLVIEACLIATSPLPLLSPLSAPTNRRGAQLALAAAALGSLLVSQLAPRLWPIAELYRRGGLADERSFYADEASLQAWSPGRRRWPDAADGRLGAAARERALTDPIAVRYSVGFFGYFAGPQVYVVDLCGLGSALLARLPPAYNPAWRIGHFARAMPAGYLDTLRTGRCLMADRELCRYDSALQTIVSAELWSWQRLRTIVAMNLGRYDDLIDVERYRYAGRRELPLGALAAPIPEATPWNAPGVLRLSFAGVMLLLPQASHAAALQLSLDGDDGYAIEYRSGETTLATQQLEPLDRSGMRRRRVATPQRARARGFDRMFVRPTTGDMRYGIGALKLLP